MLVSAARCHDFGHQAHNAGAKDITIENLTYVTLPARTHPPPPSQCWPFARLDTGAHRPNLLPRMLIGFPPSRPSTQRIQPSISTISMARNLYPLITISDSYSIDFDNSQLSADRQIYCGQGPSPPSPMVVERFQQVISQLFQQACHQSSLCIVTF